MKYKQIIGIIFLSGVLMAGCGSQETTPAEPETEQSSQGSLVLQNMLKEADEQYQNGEYDAAAGTLTLLLQNDLSQAEELQQDAEALLAQVTKAQTQDEKNEILSSTATDSDYKTERYSSLAEEEFRKDTGGEIATATDEEIEEWLTSKAEDVERRVSSKESDDSSVNSALEGLEEQEQVLMEVTEKIGIQAEGYEFFLIKEDEQMYQVEIRQSNETGDIEVSNMIGIFRYNFKTKVLEKMDPITGEYSIYSTNQA